MALTRSALLALLVGVSVTAQECGSPGQMPCNGADCFSGAVFYKPANLCAACGAETEFCCDEDSTWSCEPGLKCQIIPNPFDNNSTGAPLGLSRLCLNDLSDYGDKEPAQPGETVPPKFPDNSGTNDNNAPVELTDDGQLVGEACPSVWQQCAGKTYDEEEPKQEPMPPRTPPDDAVRDQPGREPTPQPVADRESPAPQMETVDTSNCPKVWKQCAGDGYRGIQNCCGDGSICTFQSKWYSQCRPDTSAARPSKQEPPVMPNLPKDPAPLPPLPPPPEPSSVVPRPVPSPSTVPPPPVQTPSETPLGSVETANDPPPRASVPAAARRVHRKTGLMQWLPSDSPNVAAAAEWKYELDTLLGMSYFFYEVQRAGPLPVSTRAPWRADSLNADGGGNLDGDTFKGGYFDAGDHNKFQLPTAFAVARLNWILHAFPQALEQTSFDGQKNLHWAREAAKWGADFMARSTEEDRVLLHIGDIRADHNYIGRAEMYPQMDRNILFCKPGTCSDVAAEIAASLAHAAVAFQEQEELANEYWRKAKMAYAQTGAVSGKFGASHEEYPLLAVYYTSTGVRSHVFFAAASMYTACKVFGCPDEQVYFAHTEKLGIMKEADGGQKWFWEVPGWDNAWWDGALLMAQDGIAGPEIFGKPAYTQFLRSFADKWTNGKAPIRVSPMGQRFTIEWGSNRFAMGGSAVLLMWANLPANMRGGKSVSVQDARCAAIKQLHYVAGDNDRGSYIVGFGNNPPQRNHHRNSVCAPWEQLEDKDQHCTKYFYDVISPAGICPLQADSQGRCYPEADRANKFQTHGALIGGPKTPTDAGDPERVAYSLEGWNDWRMDWVGSEQTLDYNAMYTVALAAAIELPSSFWTAPCGGVNNDLMMDHKAGIIREPPTYKDEEVYIFADFEEYGFTRTLPESWMTEIP